MASYFTVLTPETAFNDGYHLTSGAVTLGDVVKLDTAGAVLQTTGSGDQAFGFILPAKQQEYFATTNDVASGKYVTVLRGKGEALISADGFTSATVPAIGGAIYADAAGKLRTTAGAGAKVIGYCTGIDSMVDPSGPGYGPTATVNRVRFTFDLPSR